MKTETTKELEENLWAHTNKQGVFGCFEVTIGWFGSERVDYITYDTKGVWRCYEIKTSKSDFYSNAKWTFIGHYNYFVMPEELYKQVEKDIPKHVGVHTGFHSLKRARKQELQVNEQVLKDSLIRSLSREVRKAYRSKNTEILQDLERRNKNYLSELKELRKRDVLLNALVSSIRHGRDLGYIKKNFIDVL